MILRDGISGIYKITNLINGKSYIGLSRNIPTRWNEHRSHYKKGNTVLYKAMLRYGIDNFSFEIIDFCLPESLSEKEKYYIKLYRTYVGFEDCNGYNMTLGGEDSEGYVCSEEAKLKMSQKRQLGDNPAAKKVYVGDKIFGTIKEAASFLSVPPKNLARWLNKTRKISLKSKDLLLLKIGFVGEPPLDENCLEGGAKIICDGIVFNTVKDCATYLDMNYDYFVSCLKGRRKSPSKLKDRGIRYLYKETNLRFE